MAKRPKTIITCAITGAIHTPTMSDALPYTAQDIAAQAIAAAEAGAAGAGRGANTYVALDVLLPALLIFFALETLDWEVSCVPCAEQAIARALMQLRSCGRT